MITHGKLSIPQRMMSLVGAIPFVGGFAKGFAKTAIVAQSISSASKIVDNVNKVYTIGSGGASIYSTLKECKNRVVIALREAEDDFCNAIDYLQYDDGLIAASARSIGLVGCTLISPAVDLAKTGLKFLHME
jgi:hypothetical protein